MKRRLLLNSICMALIMLASSTLTAQEDRFEKRFVNPQDMQISTNKQQQLANQNAWQNFKTVHNHWNPMFDERSGLPSRAFGSPISVSGNSVQEVAWNFIAENLTEFNLPIAELNISSVTENAKHSFVFFEQKYEGTKVLGSHTVVKITPQNEVIMFGLKTFDIDALNMSPTLAPEAALEQAKLDMDFVTGESVVNELEILPIPIDGTYEYHLVYECNVERKAPGEIIAKYNMLIDAHSGEKLYAQNLVKSCKENCDHGKAKCSPSVMNIDMKGSVYPNDISDPITEVDLAYLRINLDGQNYNTDENGYLSIPVAGPGLATIYLQGSWARVQNNTTNVYPTFTANLVEGDNEVSFDANASLPELCGYVNTNRIHDYMKTKLPAFTGMDVQLQVNVEINTTDCNAFWDGNSINFYVGSSTCVDLAQLSDVVFHEYGHGINGRFYSSMGSNYNNGAMNEGYADVWGFAVEEDPILADGYDPNNLSAYFRRYDQEPKVYPQDLVGEVHADGEIIAGAWWDLYVLLGNDMDATMELFTLAYPGLQATAFNGNEGEAFYNVLLDVLQADDDDNNLENGTPNALAILEAFAIHGITLLTNVEIYHDPLIEAPVLEDVVIGADLLLEFPANLYFGGVRLNYKINDAATWSSTLMEDIGGDSFEGTIPAQPVGTLISYYLSMEDIYGFTAAVLPVEADASDPNIPYFVLVGFEQEAIHDSDNNDDWGDWEVGLPGDGAITGNWEETIPIGTYSNGIPVAPDYQTTPGGELCFVTGQSPLDPNAGIGVNDIDNGTTTLRSPVIDLTDYINPTFTYFRWYNNSPPTGANPGQDWWQVKISDDGGNTWTFVEETKTSDNSWRRMAFRVQDYVNITSQFRIQINASDSIFPGSPLQFEGGSLVEAAVDDITLWDDVAVGLDEIVQSDLIEIFPNPSSGELNINWSNLHKEIQGFEIYSNNGQLVLSIPLDRQEMGKTSTQLDISLLKSGSYQLRFLSGNKYISKSFLKVD